MNEIKKYIIDTISKCDDKSKLLVIYTYICNVLSK